MKQLTLLLTICLFSILANAQNAPIMVSNQNGTISKPFYTIDSAIFYANSGDYVYLPGGSFSINDTIDKELHVFGAGYQADSSLNTGTTIITSPIYIKGFTASNSEFSGLQLHSILVLDSNMNNLKLNQLYQSTGAPSFISSNDTFYVNGGNITNCILNSSCHMRFINSNFDNNATKGILNTELCNFRNNIIIPSAGTSDDFNVFYSNDASNNCTFLNNIIGFRNFQTMGYGIGTCMIFSTLGCPIRNHKRTLSPPCFITNYLGSTNLALNNFFMYNYTNWQNMVIDPSMSLAPASANNWFNYLNINSLDSILTNVQGGLPSNAYITSTDNLNLKPTASFLHNAGTDGKDIGVYGGNHPFRYIPSNPHFEYADIDTATNIFGVLPCNIQVKSGDTSLLVAYEYWFDTTYSKKQLINIQPNDSITIPNISNLYSIAQGNHIINFRVKNSNNIWSSTLIDSFNRVPMTQVINIEPKLYISATNIIPSTTINILGKDFFPNGITNLILTYPNGDIVTIPNNSVNLLGYLSYSLLIDNSYQGGVYKLSAYDVTATKYTSELMFVVNKPNTSILDIVKPAIANEQINVGETLILNWQDFITKDITNGFTAFSTKTYKVEVSYSNGSTWATLNNNVQFTDCLPNSMNTFFTYDFIPTQTGTCLIKITDNSNPNNFDISLPINVIQSATTNYTTSLQWDKSTTYTRPNPIGLASDGTSRILLKVSKNNPLITNINMIKATISSPENYNSTELLGKIKVATNISTYSLEGNSANAFDITDNSPSQQNDYYFWLVAPDDFAQNETNTLSERKINVSVELQSNLGTDIVYINNITIVRPPLMLVHGLNGTIESFKGSKYSVNGNTYYFAPESENITQKSNLWKVVRKLELLNYESFDLNAQILLDNYNQSSGHPNSFQGILKDMHKLGFASCRADYVCHSMGGCIARTVINKYPNEYRPSLTSTAYIKNYDSGFINKLVTINTPHNGSPHADLLYNFLPQNGINGFFTPSIYLIRELLDLKGMTTWNSNTGAYDASNAIKDLRGTLGGIRFTETDSVRNHLIGGVFSPFNNQNNYVATNFEIFTDFMASFLPPVNMLALGGNKQKIDNYINQKFGITDFSANSDVIVGINSQFPDYNISSIPNVTSNAISPVSRSIGFTSNHLQITDNIDVGTKVFHLLNSSIASNNFSSTMAPNLASGGVQYKKSRSLDSIIRYVDTIKCKFITPLTSTNLYIDSTFIVNYNIKDTVNLLGIQFQVQGRVYNLPSNFSHQSFSVKVNPDVRGIQTLYLSATYDSVGFKVFHYDTVSVNIQSKDTISSIFLTQHSYNVNKNQYLDTKILGVSNKHILNMNIENDTISYTIGNPNVLEYSIPNRSFYTHDTGSTYIVFNYHNLKDTIYVYVSPSFNNTFPLAIGLNLNPINTSNCTATLSWNASHSNEGAIFYIQKSMDGTYYSNISSLLSESNKTHYSYTDANLIHGKNYYRILVKDIDGKNYYSNIQSISSECNLSTTLKVYPNPTSEIINVDLQLNNSYKTVSLKTIDGQILETIKVTINNIQQIKFNVKGLANGTYIIVADKRNGEKEVAKFFKQ